MQNKIDSKIRDTYTDVWLLFGELNSSINGIENALSTDALKFYAYSSYLKCLYIESMLNCSLDDLKIEIEQLVNDEKIINRAKEDNRALIKYKEFLTKVKNYDKERKTSAMDDPTQEY